MSVRLTAPPEGSDALRADLLSLEERARALLRALGHEASEISVSLVDDSAMARLNEQHRGTAGPTDVLSFSLLEGSHAEHRGALLGDVVIDLEAAGRQAREIGHGLDAELLRLLIHGTLHLLGYDHEREDDARVMEERESRLWAVLSR